MFAIDVQWWWWNWYKYICIWAMRLWYVRNWGTLDHFLFLDIHCSDCSNEPTILQHHRAKYSEDQPCELDTFTSVFWNNVFIHSFLHTYNRKQTWHKIPPFIFANCRENLTQFLLLAILAYDSTPPLAECVAKTCSANFVLSPVCSLACSHR